MRKFSNLCLVLVGLLFSQVLQAQQLTTISGTVKNVNSKESVAAVSVTIKGSSAGTFTDDNGNFHFTTTQKPPFTLVFSSIGFTTKEVEYRGQSIDVEMLPGYVLGNEVVVAASRVPERILESPVSIERVSSAAIRTSPATNYYDMIGNLKGVDVTTASLTFKSVSTRGFNSSGNLRLNQIVDGMDNQAPGLNFSVGCIVGLTSLDVDNMELLSGASSALYGPGGMNGTLLINPKDPFKYQGLSFEIKQGVNHIDSYQRNRAAFYDWSVRWGQKVSEKFAFKITAQFTQAQDWLANNQSDYVPGPGGDRTTGHVVGGTRTTDPNYDGVNVYGDETNAAIYPVLQLVGAALQAPPYNVPAPYINGILSTVSTSQYVSRTGYEEKYVIDPNTVNVKLGGGLYYKLTNDLEASLVAYYGTGNSVYTGTDRYSLKNFKIGQYKFELKSKNWFLRTYTTQEDAGDSYNATIAARYFNEAWKPSGGSTGWYAQYGQAYMQARLTGASDMAAHNAARAFADQGRPTGFLPDNPIFQHIVQTPIVKGGAQFVDKTALYNTEGQYNFTDALGLAKSGTEFLIGGNWKQYVLNSQGTLFADTAGVIKINEVGAYAQLSQKLFNDYVKLTVSGRYDKNTNFQGRFTPRASAVVKLAKDHNLRFSYQQAYRFPSTQNQWINLQVNAGTYLIGGLPQLRDFYHFNTSPVYTVASVQQYQATGNPAVLVQQAFGEFKPETSTSYEVGYKGLVGGKFLIDVYGYMASYDNFIGATNVYQLATGRAFSVSTNSTGTVKTRGYGISIDYLLPRNFTIGANFYSDEITDQPDGFVTYFNTPKYRSNLTWGNTGFGHKERWGFNIIYRWQDAFHYQATFGQGDVNAIGTLDGQISYKFPAMKSLVKLGATNLLNKYYINGFGNAQVGGIYYVSFSYNVF